MGKVTWGGAVSAGDIDDAERSEFKPYDGPMPPPGLYAFKITHLRHALTRDGSKRMLKVGMKLVPRQSRPDDKRYQDFPLWDNMTIEGATSRYIASFCDAIGVSGADFVNKMTDDGSDKNNILRIGRVEPVGKFVLVNIKASEYNGAPKREVDFAGYYPPPAAGTTPEPDPEPAGADDDPPF